MGKPPPPPGQAYGGPDPDALRRNGWRPLLPRKFEAVAAAIMQQHGFANLRDAVEAALIAFAEKDTAGQAWDDYQDELARAVTPEGIAAVRAITEAGQKTLKQNEPAPLPMPSQEELNHALYWVGSDPDAERTVEALIDIAKIKWGSAQG